MGQVLAAGAVLAAAAVLAALALALLPVGLLPLGPEDAAGVHRLQARAQVAFVLLVPEVLALALVGAWAELLRDLVARAAAPRPPRP